MKSKSPQRGFTLVELMVALVVGMLAMVFVTRTMVSFESSRRNSSGGSDSLQNGMVGMFTLQNEMSQAGWDLNEPWVLGCPARFSDTSGFALANDGTGTRLGPVIVTFNGTIGDPDTITTYSGSSFGGAGAYQLYATANAAATTLYLTDPVTFGFNNSDVLLVAVPGNGDPTVGPTTDSTCQIIEANALTRNFPFNGTTVTKVDFNAMRFSPAGGLPIALTNTGAAGVPTQVFDLGPETGLAFHTWSITNGRLMMRATNVTGSSNIPQAVVSNIVSIKALYGFDTRTAVGGFNSHQMQITQWTRGLIDSNGDGVINQYDYDRLVAVRLAVVARSREVEKLPSSGVCTTTSAQPTVFQSQEPAGVPTTAITVNISVAGDPIPWQCYSYKVFETIVSLRNTGWRPGQ